MRRSGVASRGSGDRSGGGVATGYSSSVASGAGSGLGFGAEPDVGARGSAVHSDVAVEIGGLATAGFGGVAGAFIVALGDADDGRGLAVGAPAVLVLNDGPGVAVSAASVVAKSEGLVAVRNDVEARTSVHAGAVGLADGVNALKAQRKSDELSESCHGEYVW